MAKLRDSSELREAASLLTGLLTEQGGPGAGRFRSERLQKALARACDRAGFLGMLLLDERGLAMAQHALTLEAETVAGLCLTLANVFTQADTLLGQDKSQRITIDLGRSEKLSVRRFTAANNQCWLVVQASMEVDERAEVQQVLLEIAEILGGA